MVKRIAAIVTIMLLMTVVTSASDVTSWLLWSRDADNSVEARVGLDTDPIEFGILSRWWPIDDTPQVAGVYALLHYPDPIELPNPFAAIIPGIPDVLHGHAYGGGSFGVDILDDSDDRSFSAWQAGILVCGPGKDKEKQDVCLVFEWMRADYKDAIGAIRDDEDVLSFGVRITF